jgi:predicted phosphodiesterase
MFDSWKKRVDPKNYQKRWDELDVYPDVFIHGHDHFSRIDNEKGVIVINPGSTTLPRNTSYGTYVIGFIKDSKLVDLKIEKI